MTELHAVLLAWAPHLAGLAALVAAMVGGWNLLVGFWAAQSGRRSDATHRANDRIDRLTAATLDRLDAEVKDLRDRLQHVETQLSQVRAAAWTWYGLAHEARRAALAGTTPPDLPEFDPTLLRT